MKQKRRKCPVCNRRPLVFTRQGEKVLRLTYHDNKAGVQCRGSAKEVK